jgi:hypothetical protein
MLLKEAILMFPNLFSVFLLPVIAGFWIFVLWAIWTITRSIREMDESLKRIVVALRDRGETR